MADEQETPDVADEAAEDESPKKGGRLVSIVMIVVGLAMGSGAGLFFVGPRFFGGPSEVSAEATDETADEADSGEDDGHGAPADDGHGGDSGEAESTGTVHTIANLIVNPAGSNGNRFLLVDLAVGVSSEETVTELESLDVAARDELVLVFGSKTVQELADVTLRDQLKDEIAIVIGGLLHTGSVQQIFFPRFVIQ